MSSHVLICDFNEKLLSRLKNRKLVVRLNDPRIITHAIKVVREKNIIHSIWLHSNNSLSDLSLDEPENLEGVKLKIEVEELGEFREWIKIVPLLRELQSMVFLSETTPGSYRDLRILSSLNVPCGIIFGDKSPDWEALLDLMSYAVYGKVPHAPIQPFHYVISEYGPSKRTDFYSVYFENPSKFFHVDPMGRIAFSRKELEKGEFISSDLDNLDEVKENPEYHNRLEAWRDFFLKSNGCAYCAGWRICLGKFAGKENRTSGCKKFFIELLEAADYYQDQRERNAVSSPWT